MAAAGIATLGVAAAAVATTVHLGRAPAGIGAVADSQAQNSGDCAAYQPAPRFNLDVCLGRSGSVVTPSVVIHQVDPSATSCGITLEVWDDAGNRVDSRAPAPPVSCATATTGTGRALDLSRLSGITAHTAPDGSLTVHAYARITLNGQRIYNPDQGNSPSVTVPPTPSTGSIPMASHTSPDSMTGPAGELNIPTVTATSVGGFFGGFTAVVNATGIFCYEAGGVVPCYAQPEPFILTVANAATDAHIDPRLLLAVMLNERGIKISAIPHVALLELGRLLIGKDPSLGMTNLKASAFADAQKAAGPGNWISKHQFSDLALDPVLGIAAAAWELRGLEGQLPSVWPGNYKRDELLAVGHNIGGSVMDALASGLSSAQADPADPAKADWYVSAIDYNWSDVDQLVCGSGAFTCSSQ